MKGCSMRMGSSAVFRSLAINTGNMRLRHGRGRGGTGGHGFSYAIVTARELISVAAQDGGRFHVERASCCCIMIIGDEAAEMTKPKKIPGDGRYNPGSYD